MLRARLVILDVCAARRGRRVRQTVRAALRGVPSLHLRHEAMVLLDGEALMHLRRAEGLAKAAGADAAQYDPSADHHANLHLGVVLCATSAACRRIVVVVVGIVGLGIRIVVVWRRWW